MSTVDLKGMHLRVIEHRYDEILCEDVTRGEPSGKYVIIEVAQDSIIASELKKK